MGSFQPFTGNAIPYAEWPEEVKQYYRYDPEAAEKLLDEAGYPRGADGIRFTISDIYRFTPQASGYREIVQGYLAEIGVQVEIRQQDWSTMQANFGGGKGEYDGITLLGGSGHSLAPSGCSERPDDVGPPQR